MTDLFNSIQQHYKISDAERWIIRNMINWEGDALIDLLEDLEGNTPNSIPSDRMLYMSRNELLIRVFDHIVSNHGIERIEDDNVTIVYSNAGDTYHPTLLYYRDNEGYGELTFASWGDIVESYMA